MEANNFYLDVQGVAAIPYIVKHGTDTDRREISRSEFGKAMIAWFAAEAERLGTDTLVLSIDGLSAIEVKILEPEEGSNIRLPHRIARIGIQRIVENIPLYEEEHVIGNYFFGTDELGWVYLHNMVKLIADITLNPLNTDKYLVSELQGEDKILLSECNSLAQAKRELAEFARKLSNNQNNI